MSTIPCNAGCCGSSSYPCCTFDATQCNRNTNRLELGCSGYEQPDIFALTSLWANNNCISNYSSILYNTNGLLIYNPDNLARLQGDVANLFDVYTSCENGGYCLDFTSDANSQKYNPFQNNVLDLCSSELVPGICSLSLTDYCAKYTPDDLGQDSVKAALCGCMLPPEYPNVSPACQSMCHMTNTSQLADPETGIIQVCDNTVCVLDNNNIGLTDTSTSTSFTQLCSGCGDPTNPCVCIIGGPDPSQTIVDAGISPTYNQYCGTNSICYNTSTGVAVEVPCPPESSFGFSSPSYNFPLIIISVVVFIVIILIIIFAATRGKGSYIEVKKEVPYTGPNYSNPQEMLNAASTGQNVKMSGVPRTSSTQFTSGI